MRSCARASEAPTLSRNARELTTRITGDGANLIAPSIGHLHGPVRAREEHDPIFDQDVFLDERKFEIEPGLTEFTPDFAKPYNKRLLSFINDENR